MSSTIITVKLTFKDGQVFTMTPDDFERIGYSAGFCKANKLLIKDLQEIEYTAEKA